MAKNKKTAKASKATPKTDQLRKLREQQQEATPKPQETAKDAKKQQGETKAKSKAEKPAQAKPKSSKATLKREAVKPVESGLSEQKTSKQVASSRNVFGFSIAAILRWMGDNAVSEEQAKRALASYKIDPMPKDRSVKHYLDYKNNPKCMGAVPDLTKAQASEIKNRAKE